MDVLESIIDTITTDTCKRVVCGDLMFDLSMLPGPGETVICEFCKCYQGVLNIPRVIFDPAFFGNGGRVVLPPGSRFGFTGFGIVEMEDGVTIEFTGQACDFDTPQPDWPELLFDEGATMVLSEGATVVIGGGTTGAGVVLLRSGGAIVLDQPDSHLIFGEDEMNQLFIQASFGSHITVDNASALISYHLALIDLLFDNNSSLQISNGIVEFNVLNDMESPGVLRRLEFINDSSLVLPGQCDERLGLLRFAPNNPNSTCASDSENTLFNNLEGHIAGHGDVQFVQFNGLGERIVDTTTQIQNNSFSLTAPLVDIFMQLSYILDNDVIMAPDFDILALQGTRPTQSLCGRLVAFCPSRDGRVVGLAQGDHDVFYDSSESCGTLNLVRGYDRLGIVFTISDCNEATRTPPVPPITPTT